MLFKNTLYGESKTESKIRFTDIKMCAFIIFIPN